MKRIIVLLIVVPSIAAVIAGCGDLLPIKAPGQANSPEPFQTTANYQTKYVYEKKFICSERSRFAFGEDIMELHDLKTIQFFADRIAEISDYGASATNIVIFDVGASIGAFTALQHFVPGNLSMVSFEPNPNIFSILQENSALNNVNATLNNLTLGDQEKELVLKMPASGHSGLATLGDSPLRFEKDNLVEIRVKQTTIDNYCAQNNIQKIDLIKIDTEGWELFVLRGAENMIAKHKPKILMEYNTTNMLQCGVNAQDIKDFLEKYNYRCRLVSEDDQFCE